jgi:hypothetical protein
MVNENNKPYIGITGITCTDDVEVIKKALGDSYGMYGVLVSRNTLKNGKPHRGRYPSISSLKDIFRVMPENALRAVHYNSEHADYLSKDVKEIVQLTDCLCNCIQLNIEYPPLDQVIKIKNENNDLKIIFQLGKNSMKGNAHKKVSLKMAPYIPYIDYILIDASQGAGVELKILDTFEFAKPLKNLKTLTFAGGLDGTSLYKFISLVEDFCAGVDAEGKLMNNDDTLDHEKIRSYVRAAKTIKGFKQEVKSCETESDDSLRLFIEGK